MPSQFLEQRSPQCVPCCLDKQGTEGHCPEKRARSIPSEHGAHHAASGSSANDPVSLFLSLGLQLADLFNLTSAPRTQMHISALRHRPPRNVIRHLSPWPLLAWSQDLPQTPRAVSLQALLLTASQPQALASFCQPETCFPDPVWGLWTLVR